MRHVDIAPGDGRLNVNPWHIRIAAERLGLQWPIRIGWLPSGDLAGCYEPSRYPRHTIRLSVGLSARSAAATIRHELAHCVQAERPGGLLEADRDAYERAATDFELSGVLSDLEFARDRPMRRTQRPISMRARTEAISLDQVSINEIKRVAQQPGDLLVSDILGEFGADLEQLAERIGHRFPIDPLRGAGRRSQSHGRATAQPTGAAGPIHARLTGRSASTTSPPRSTPPPTGGGQSTRRGTFTLAMKDFFFPPRSKARKRGVSGP